MPAQPSMHASPLERPSAPPTDPSRLAEHCRRCAAARGRLHRLRCAAEAVHAFLAPRLITTLVAAVLLLVLLPSGAALH